MSKYVLFFLAVLLTASASPDEVGRAKFPQVVVSWDDSGDFGPQTPNTKTAGWQEAINYCVANGRDLYAKGGWGGRKAVYNVSDTIRIPATQDFRIDGGVYVLNWTGPANDPSKDLMVIDSTMNGEYHFGIFVYGGAGAALRIKPEKPVPIDGFAVMVETEIKSQGMADPAPFKAGERKAGAGLVLDGTKAAITCNRFDFIGGILNFKTCVEAKGNFFQNQFTCLHLHTNADKSTLFSVGQGCAQNAFHFAIGVDQGAAGVTGIDIFGRNNRFEINTRGGFPPGNDIVLEAPAEGNRIDLVHGKKKFDPAEFMTDKSVQPGNRLSWAGANVPIKTVAAAPGLFNYVQRLYPATVRLIGTGIGSVKLVRGRETIDCAGAAASGIFLDVADGLRVESTAGFQMKVLPFGGAN